MSRVLSGTLSMLAHDLRTPLSAMTAWLYLLESATLDPAAKKQALHKIRANVEDQVQLIDDALLLARFESGDLRLELGPVPPWVPLAAAMESMRDAALARGVDLGAVDGVGDGDGTIRADAGILQRAFKVLFEQALKNTAAGGMVRTTVRARDGHVEITIADNGRGIAADILPCLLDPFARQGDDAPGRQPGVERRLLVAKAVVEAHAGRFRVTSPGEGLGTTFAVELPVSRSIGLPGGQS
ncbi:MAG: HAMP domain-containing histidine kinase [Betaproteobacteria bacterium]|nr:HAMP domain-containing histidine kinase [Betaproteobacteria bacterium]